MHPLPFNVSIADTNIAWDIFILKKYLLLVLYLTLTGRSVFYLVILFIIMIIFCQAKAIPILVHHWEQRHTGYVAI